MYEVPIVGRDERMEQLFEGCYDAPAYVRRARAVEDAFARVLERCRWQRQEWLELVRVRLGLLQALAGDWERLRPLLAAGGDLDRVRALFAELAPRLRHAVSPARSERALRRAAEELNASIARFNGRWRRFLGEVDLAAVNALREGYNRYYLLEKECAVRSARVARAGYRPLAPVTAAALEAIFPLLPEGPLLS